MSYIIPQLNIRYPFCGEYHKVAAGKNEHIIYDFNIVRNLSLHGKYSHHISRRKQRTISVNEYLCKQKAVAKYRYVRNQEPFEAKYEGKV